MLVSIAINNFNYGKFLRECIDSALNQTYQQLEVIVVDDGSTDDSRSIIKSYGKNIISVLKENGGQGSAYNAGFAKAEGDIIIFLDSDDYLFSDTVARLVEIWTPDIAKVHFRLAMVDEDGESMGSDMPNFLHSGDVKDIIENFGCYASPPASGNAFSRHSLEKYFPMDEAEWRIAADTYPIILAPYLGKVEILDGTGGVYRIHKKLGQQEKFVLNNSPSTPWASVERSYQSKRLILKALIEHGLISSQSFHFYSPAEVKIRLISLRVDPHLHPIVSDSSFKVLYAGFMAIFNWPDYAFKTRMGYAIWMIGVALSPQFLAEKMILWAINSKNRPHLVQMFLNR
ncbi:MAG: glycosyltransferase family 2 protein [Sulfuriferula sp.]